MSSHLVASTIIDILRRRRGRVKVLDNGTNAQTCLVLADAIEKADKYDFGDLLLEPIPPDQTGGLEGVVQVPKITPDEWGFWHDGYIPLPATVCWFEFVINGYRSGLLIMDDSPEWSAYRIDYLSDEELYADTTCAMMSKTPGDRDIPETVNLSNISPSMMKDRGLMTQTYGHVLALGVYLALMLNSKSTEREVKKTPTFINKTRAKKGKAPLFGHTVVTIVPEKYRRPEYAGGTHASPRLHWRRSHLRVYKASSGEIYHRAVIPRHLVGKAELGEVSHEYRIKDDRHPGTETTRDGRGGNQGSDRDPPEGEPLT